MKLHYLTLIALMSLAVGCQQRVERESIVYTQEQADHVVMIVFDLSGSFAHLMGDDGKGYEFALSVIDQYFRDRLGTQDRLILAQISGTNRALLWEGTPQQLRHDFSSADQFRDFLDEKAHPGGSMVVDGISHALEYIMSDPDVASGHAKPAVFVLSDLMDNLYVSDDPAQRLDNALADYGQLGGLIGFYYVDQLLMPEWRTRVRTAQIKNAVLQCEIVGRPQLPSFD